jgi:hypothetical protein
VGQKCCGGCPRICQNVTSTWTNALNTLSFLFLLKMLSRFILLFAEI